MGNTCKNSSVFWCLIQKNMMQFVEIKSLKMLDVFLPSAFSHQFKSLHPTWSQAMIFQRCRNCCNSYSGYDSPEYYINRMKFPA